MGERKFKVGDRVKCIRNTWSRPILNECGTVCRIIEGYLDYAVGIEFDKYIDGHSCHGHCKEGYGWNLEPNEIELVEKPWKVLIMPDGDKTTGRLYENGKVVKSVETKKHPGDEYSIEAACKVIMERLFEPKYIRKDKYEIGDRVRIRSWEDMEKEYGVRGSSIPCNASFTKYMNHLCGRLATITAIKPNGRVELNFDSKEGDLVWTYSTDMIECEVPSVKEPPKQTYYNGKVVCTKEVCGLTTKGKIYEFVDGRLTCDDGDKSYPKMKNFEEINSNFRSEFIEVVE